MRLSIARIASGLLAAMLPFGAFLLPAAAQAQAIPPYAVPGSTPGIISETITGTIEEIQGPYRILLRDDRGFIDNVTLRAGTIINPRGVRLVVGMLVTIDGYADGSTFAALEIDSQSQYDAGTPGGAYYSGGDYGYYGAGGYYYVESPPSTVINNVIVQPPPSGAQRRIEPPNHRRPVRRPLDGNGTGDQPPLPPYASPGLRVAAPPRVMPGAGQPAAPVYRASPPEYRAAPPPSAPAYRPAPPPAPAPVYHAAPPPPAPRSEPVRDSRPAPSNNNTSSKPH